MAKRDKEYYLMETVTLGCYAVGVALAYGARFIPFILLTLAAYPISNKILNKIQEGNCILPGRNKNIKGVKNGIF